MKEQAWIKFRGYERAKKATLPGVWKLRQGGYLIRGRVKSDKTGSLVEVCRVLDVEDAAAALQILRQGLAQAKNGAPSRPARMRFDDWSASALEERVATGEIRSASTKRSWLGILRDHLLQPWPEGWGGVFLDAITPADVMDWRKRCGELVNRDGPCLACRGERRMRHGQGERRCPSCKGRGRRRYGPRTINQWFAKFQAIMAMAKSRRLIAEDPAADLAPLPTDLATTYTEEEPNSLTPEEAVVFLDEVWRRYPRWYAMVVLGMATGRRPSELRPLRKAGATPDLVFLPDGRAYLLVRRSHSEGDEVMERTKTGARLRITLPVWLAGVLRWHVDLLPPGPQQASELLFPAWDGSLLDECCLYDPFRRVARALPLGKRITPRALRRSYQDLQREAGTVDLVTRSISGHLTESMQRHYSTVRDDEQAASLDRVGKLLRFPAGGVKGGASAANEAQVVSGGDERCPTENIVKHGGR